MADSGLGAIVLAAGAGTRFGGPKQLAMIDGLELVVRAARLARGCCPAGVVVVTGAYGAEVEAALAAEPVSYVRNRRWASGLASSIRCGVDAGPPHASAWLMLLADQAWIAREDLERLVAQWCCRPDQPAASKYESSLGVPAIFPARFREQLRSLTGQEGARGLLAGLPDVTAVPMPLAAHDVDQVCDLDRRPSGA